MFEYILRVRGVPDEQQAEYFRRFTEQPGLLHAFDLQGVDDPEDGVAIAIWEDRAAAERYLNEAALRREVDATYPDVTRTMYEVLDAT